jgi:hypothetical protein
MFDEGLFKAAVEARGMLYVEQGGGHTLVDFPLRVIHDHMEGEVRGLGVGPMMLPSP